MAHSHDEVAHRFAHQSGRGNAARGFNMFYDGDTIYSYGAHFPIARIVKFDGATPDVVLMTTETYSVSTSKHCTIVRRAISHMPKFYVENVRANSADAHAANADAMADGMAQCLERCAKRRNAAYAEMDLARADEVRSAHADYCAMFNVERAPLSMPDNIADIRKALDVRRTEQRAAEHARKVERERKAAAELAEKLPRWRAGENISLPYTGSGVYMLRVNGDTIETSGHARFPVADAVRAFPLLCKLRERGTVTDGGGVRLGMYSVDHISADGVRAGCHFIKWDEVERIAGELNLV